jgi:hypothetical protein
MLRDASLEDMANLREPDVLAEELAPPSYGHPLPLHIEE